MRHWSNNPRTSQNFELVHKVPQNSHLVTHNFFYLLILDVCSIFRVAKECFEWKDASQTHKDTKLSSIVP
ncbi:hypothetical protein CEW81_15950 [Kluyvera genomosp. 3]|uniref:Uncharacterized protein n=1 Tax=Kluyvera genomosp. 3 TaxID=2774055 RepID=A0A248KM06_9ENTR|nr:hypothetical protein CEW81_15950 [Kluyvera genomosp. 3]